MEVPGFQERLCVILQRFSVLCACLTKAVEAFHCRIRLVAFLRLLTSGGFGLCLESQWSNRRVCHFAEHSIDCGKGNNAFSFPWGESASVLWSILSHLRLQLWRSPSSKSFWNHGRSMYVWFPISSWKETKNFILKCFCIYRSGFDLRYSPQNSARQVKWAFVIKCLHCFYYPRIEHTVLVLLFLGFLAQSNYNYTNSCECVWLQEFRLTSKSQWEWEVFVRWHAAGTQSVSKTKQISWT